MTLDRDARLDAIYRRGRSLRTIRRRKVVAIPLALAVVPMLLLVTMQARGGEQADLVTTALPAGEAATLEPALAPEPSVEITLPAPTTTSASLAAPVESAPSTTVATVAPPAPSTTTAGVTTTASGPTTTTLVCRNSHDPRCGPFRYDPVPTNQPTVLSATPSATTLPAGTAVSLHVLATDPDSAITPPSCGGGVDWSDPDAMPVPCASTACVTTAPRFGPWDPPTPTPGRYDVNLSHTYEKPGTYDVVVRVGTFDCGDGPYRERAETSVRITVTP